MKKRVFIVHGWDGYPDEGWFPWLKKELEKLDYMVTIPAMPKPEAPEISSWLGSLNEVVGHVDEHTYFIGHSIGCQTIIRFIEGLENNIVVGGAIFVAGWTQLTSEATPDEESTKIAKPWLESPIYWEKVKRHTNNFIAVFSNNDPMVSLSEKDIFEEKLGAKIIVKSNMGHLSGDDGVRELPVVLNELTKI